jgi:hypothetical protein
VREREKEQECERERERERERREKREERKRERAAQGPLPDWFCSFFHYFRPLFCLLTLQLPRLSPSPQDRASRLVSLELLPQDPQGPAHFISPPTTFTLQVKLKNGVKSCTEIHWGPD